MSETTPLSASPSAQPEPMQTVPMQPDPVMPDAFTLGTLWEWLTYASYHFPVLTQIGLILVLLILVIPVQYISRLILVHFGSKISKKTKSNLDNLMVEHRVPNHLSHLVPAAFILYATAALQEYFSATVWSIIVNATNGIMALAITAALASVVAVAQNKLMGSRHASRLGLKGYAQIVKLIIYLVGGIIAVSLFIGQNPTVLIGSLAGMTAILMLVFKDTILGFVASIKIATEDLIRPGDWIEIPSAGIDGDVIDMTVNTIKVQNWDKTIATVPTSTIMTDSFRNWRGMQDSGGRRIKRAIYLDQTSIDFLNDQQVEEFTGWQLLHDYLKSKSSDIADWQHDHDTEKTTDITVPYRRQLTNVGTFRAYVSAYLRSRNHSPDWHDISYSAIGPGAARLATRNLCFHHHHQLG